MVRDSRTCQSSFHPKHFSNGVGRRLRRDRSFCSAATQTPITAYLEGGGTLENAQNMAAHESPRTTKLYDRTSDAITLDEVERIKI